MVIKCLAYYDALDSKDKRVNSPAAYTKTAYVIDCFKRLGYKVDILSASNAIGKKGAKGSTRSIDEGVTLRTLSSLGRGHKVKNVISTTLFSLNLLFHLLFFVHKGDVLWVYHSLPLMKYIKLLKGIKKFKLILEAEEIYGDVDNSQKTIEKELACFNYADAYIFCTQLLSGTANPSGKPEAVSHGSYQAQPCFDVHFDDDKIHVVYAGTFNPKKGGVFTAINAGRFLDERYHLHVLGGGTADEVQNIKKLVKKASAATQCTITYDGFFNGKNYLKFLQKCHIGLSTQNPYEQFNQSSFPSKVLVYMANGLRVVSIKAPAVCDSSVKDYVWFCDEATPQSVAETIKIIDLNAPYDGRKIISNLDSGFLESLERLLKDLASK